MSELTGWAMSKVVNWFMILIIFVFDPLAIGMIVAANMAFANIKGVARDPKDYEVYKEKIITKEVPVEVEKIVEKEVIKEVIIKEEPKLEPKVEAHEEIDPRFKGALDKAITHIRRAGIKIPNTFWRKD